MPRLSLWHIAVAIVSVVVAVAAPNEAISPESRSIAMLAHLRSR